MRFRVHGFCLMPMEAEIELDADTPELAVEHAMAAWNADKRALIVGGSGDESAAFDWRPTVEPA